MSTANVNDPGVPFEHFYELPDGVRLPALHPKDVEMEGGTIDAGSTIEKLRASVESTLAASHRPLLATLSLHQLTVMQATYTGWCAAYYRAVMQKSAGVAEQPRPSPAPQVQRAAAPSRVVPRRGGVKEIQQPFTPLVPGQPLPGLLGGHEWGVHGAEPFKFKVPIGQPCIVPSN